MLPGYGVEAVLKNMEYSAIDDKAKADAATAAKKAAKKGKAGSSGNEDLSDIDVSSLGEVKGFKFDVLAQRKPHLVQELMTFRDVLMSNDEEEAIKVGQPTCPSPVLAAMCLHAAFQTATYQCASFFNVTLSGHIHSIASCVSVYPCSATTSQHDLLWLP